MYSDLPNFIIYCPGFISPNLPIILKLIFNTEISNSTSDLL
jgi:hypothetical protein